MDGNHFFNICHTFPDDWRLRNYVFFGTCNKYLQLQNGIIEATSLEIFSNTIVQIFWNEVEPSFKVKSFINIYNVRLYSLRYNRFIYTA